MTVTLEANTNEGAGTTRVVPSGELALAITEAIRVYLERHMDVPIGVFAETIAATLTREYVITKTMLPEYVENTHKKYTAKWVEIEAHNKKAYRLDHHECGICGVMVYYSLQPRVTFISGCGCGSWTPPRPSSWSEIADWLQMQKTDEMRDNILKGLK